MPVGAEIIGVETFDYADGNVASQNGGLFWDFKNTAPAGRSGTASTWDIVTNTPTFNAGQLVTSGNGVAKREYNGSNESEGAISDANVAKDVYYRVNVTTGPTISAGDYFGISSVDGGTERLYFGKRGGSTTWGVEEVGVGGTNSIDSSDIIQANTTYTLVVHVDLDGDGIRLYVNPFLNEAQTSFNNNNNSLAANRAYTGTAASTAVRFAAGTGSTPIRWDNLVVATSWEELGLTVVTTLVDEDDGASSLNTTSDISLREAVKYSPTGSRIMFAPGLSGRTITLTHVDGDMSIDRALTIDATALSGGLTVDGNGSTRHFDVTPTGSLSLSGMTLNRGNRAGGNGGSIDNRGTLRLHRCTFDENVTDSGGAIRSIGEMEATQCTFSNNTAESGGGIYIEGGNAELRNCTLFGNQAFGAIEKRGTGDLGLFNCTIANNHAGGVIAVEGTVDMNFCTVSQNRGKGLGGGLFYRSPATVTLFGTVIAGNTDTSSSIVGPDVYKFTAVANLTLADKNFIGTLVNSGIAPGPDVLEGDPKLSALGDFGGPVQTMHPLIGSPLIDVIPPGDPEDATDARGFPGLVDGDTASAGAQYDLGAVEAGPLRTVAFSSDTGSSGSLRGRIGQSTEPGARIGFFAANFPSRSITLELGQLEIPATANGLFIDASNLTGPVTVSGGGNSRVFNIASGATVAMHSLRIVGGQSSGNGGGVLNAGKLMVMSSLLSGNGSSNMGGGGGGICNELGATCVVVGSTLTENDGTFGGAILNEGVCTMIDSTLNENTARSGGGGIFSSHTLNVRSSAFVENGAISGGGIRVDAGTCSVISSTFKGNSATFGGGINSATSSTCNVISCTLSENAATTSGGGIVRFDGVLNVNSTIVTGNTPDNISFGHTGANNIIGMDAKLAPLGDYGGRTQTMAFLPGSPARDAGGASGLGSDQRGFPVVGAPDVGAYEAQIGFIESVSVFEGGPPVVFNFEVGQIGTLSVISSSNTALVPVANIVLGGSGASRSVTLTPVVHQLGSSEVTLRDSLTGETQSFTLTVEPFANTIVTNTNDGGAGSLRQALIAAALIAGPNTITFAPGFTGPIVLGSEFIINDSHPVAIDASSLFLGLGLDGNDGVRHFFVQAGSKLTLRVITLRSGFSLFDGGSIYSEGNLILDRCFLLLNGSSASGGAIRSQGPFQAVDCVFSLNSASQAGGAVRYGGATELTRCTFSGNTALQQGGAIFHGSGLTATLTQCSLTDNEVPASGTTGGIEAVSGTLNMVHCTIVGNKGGLAGGGLSVPSAAIVNITNCIIARNTRVSESMERIPADLFVDLLEADVNPMGANLIGSNDRVASLFPAGPLVGTPTNPLDPDLANLQNSGGFSSVMLPNPSSPAIDQASTLSPALTTDQRGAPRPMGLRSDLGAAESSIIIVTTPVDELDVPGVIGNGISLREAVRDVPLRGTIGFDRAVFNSPSSNQIILTEGPLNPQRDCYLDGTRNPGGILFKYIPTILQQPVPVSASSGESVSFNVLVKALSGGVGYGWSKGGIFLTTTPIGTLNLPSVGESDEGVYDVVLDENTAPGTFSFSDNTGFINQFFAFSQPAALVVDGALISVQREPASAMLPLGGSHTLRVVAGPDSVLALSYQWTRDGKKIPGATSSSYVIPKAAFSHAGAYTCVIKFGAASITTATAEIGVVETGTVTVNLKAGSKLTLVAKAAGNGLSYLWSSGQTSSSFVLNPVAVSSPPFFVPSITGPGGTITGKSTLLNVSSTAPALATPLVLPPAYIGQNYFYQLPAVDTLGAVAASFSVSGALPKGMVFNRTTGVLSGRPTVTKAGGYALSFRAINASGSSAAVAGTLTVNVVPPTAVGVFAGPLGRSVLNGNLGGRIDLTTAASGSFSGSITLGTVRRSFRNQLLLSAGQGDAILRGNISGIRLADNTLVTAYVEVFAAEQVARVTLLGADGTTLLGTAWRNPWRVSRTPALNNPATGYAANYTVRLDAGSGSSASPEGYGFASFTVSSAGLLTLAGRLPDGSGITGRTHVGLNGEVLVFNLLYGNRGSQVGQWGIGKAVAVVDNAVTGTTSWLKPGPLAGSKDTIYRAGFGPLGVTAAGGVYVAPTAGQLVMGLPVVAEGQSNTAIVFSEGGLGELGVFSQGLRFFTRTPLDAVNRVSVVGPVTNGVRVTSLDSRKGTFGGSFVIPGATVALNRSAPFVGQVVKIGAVREAFGYFLLPGVPVGTETVGTVAKRSGKVVIARK